MKRLLLTCLLVLTAASAAWGMNLRQGFGKYRYGESCDTMFGKPSFAVERARPIWNAQLQMFGLAYDPETVAKSPFILHYDRDEKPEFDGVPLNRIYYGCNKDSGRFSLVVLVHDLLSVGKLVESGLLALTAGADTIRLMPPLTITKTEIDAGLAILNRILSLY